jgi:hypothetical protein
MVDGVFATGKSRLQMNSDDQTCEAVEAAYLIINVNVLSGRGVSLEAVVPLLDEIHGRLVVCGFCWISAKRNKAGKGTSGSCNNY